MKIEKINFSKNTLTLEFDHEIRQATFLKNNQSEFDFIVLNDVELSLSPVSCKKRDPIIVDGKTVDPVLNSLEDSSDNSSDNSINILREAINKLENEL